MTMRVNPTARRVSPNDCTGFVVPSNRAPAGTKTCASVEYMGVETRQFTGAAAAPSNRLMRTVSMMVPSRMRWAGPSAALNSGERTGAGADVVGAIVAGLAVVLVLAVDARTTASATSSKEGDAAPSSALIPGVLRRGDALRIGSV